ncbi:MAG: HD-GYP domain-containing protein [Lachnospiraceae bacterium]|nr:HD-GYP domain-containing protein [Lachnospiraceae bacterium]
MKVPNLSLVTYVYLIFSVVFILSEGGTFKETDGSLVFFYSVGIAKTTVLFIATLLIYLLVIRALSELTDRKREINWKLFVISPSVFIPVYTVVDYVSYMYGGEKVYIASQFFSTVILFLFIWAFYIIIKNINATNEAIDARETIKTLSVEVMEALAHTIDAKDKYTNGHSIRVAKYSRMIAEKMGLDAGTCENIYYMGLLHDIGKIGVSNEIINKPSRLTEAEYDIIKTHPGIGYNILFEIKSNPALAIGAHWHHERYDGKGYPDGIAGEDIPLEARIIAVADSYDAMTSNRSYRNYLPQEKVREEIEKNIGTQFDPEAAKCMLAIMEEDREYRLHE